MPDVDSWLDEVAPKKSPQAAPATAAPKRELSVDAWLDEVAPAAPSPSEPASAPATAPSAVPSYRSSPWSAPDEKVAMDEIGDVRLFPEFRDDLTKPDEKFAREQAALPPDVQIAQREKAGATLRDLVFKEYLRTFEDSRRKFGGAALSPEALAALYPQDEQAAMRLTDRIREIKEADRDVVGGPVEQFIAARAENIERSLGAVSDAASGVGHEIRKKFAGIAFGDERAAGEPPAKAKTIAESNLPPGYLETLNEEIERDPVLKWGGRAVDLAVYLPFLKGAVNAADVLGAGRGSGMVGFGGFNALTTPGGVEERKESGLHGAMFAGLLGVLNPESQKVLMAWLPNASPEAQAVLGEALAFAAAGQTSRSVAGDGFDLGELGFDLGTGGVFGALGGRSGLVKPRTLRSRAQARAQRAPESPPEAPVAEAGKIPAEQAAAREAPAEAAEPPPERQASGKPPRTIRDLTKQMEDFGKAEEPAVEEPAAAPAAAPAKAEGLATEFVERRGRTERRKADEGPPAGQTDRRIVEHDRRIMVVLEKAAKGGDLEARALLERAKNEREYESYKEELSDWHEKWTGRKLAMEPVEETVADAVEEPAPRTLRSATGKGGGTPEEMRAEIADIEGPQELPQRITSTKNRIVDAERAERGDELMEKAVRRAWPEEIDGAKREVEDNPSRPYELVDSLTEKPRAVNPREQAILQLHRVELNNALDRAHADGIEAGKRGDADAVAESQIRADRAHSELLRSEVVSRQSGGTETARSLAFRRAEFSREYSLERMEAERMAANGYKPLTPKQQAETRNLYEQLQKANADAQAYKEKLAESEAQRALDAELIQMKKDAAPRRLRAPKPRDKQYGATNRIFTRELYESTLASARSKMSRMSAGLDPTLLADLAKVGGFHLEAGLRNFGRWSKTMIEALGENIRPHLGDVWRESRKLYGDSIRSESVASMREARDSGKKPADMQRQIREIAEDFLAQGVRERDPLIDAVHGVLREVDPEITRRETMDAISGYGQTSLPSRDQVKQELRELSGQMQQVAKLEDMASGRAPLKSGPQRQPPGDVQRQLIRMVNEAKRRGGYDVKDPASQLRSALDAVKTRLRNQISDIERQLRTQTRDESKRSDLTYDQEASALKAQRDTLREQYDELFGRRGLTDEQRVRLATASVEKSIGEYERRISEKDLFPEKKSRKTPVTPELEALRARRDALHEELRELQMIERPPKTKEEIALQSLKTRMRRQIAQLKDRLATGNLESPKPKRVMRDNEAVELESRLEMVRRQWGEALIADKLKNRTRLQKILTGIFVEAPNTFRSIMTSLDLSAVLRQGGFVALGHPIRAARAMPAMFRALKSPAAQARVEAEIRTRPTYKAAQDAGVFFSEHGPSRLSQMEEAYMSRWADKIPLVAASARAYTTFLNRLRMDSWDAMSSGLTRNGEATPAEAKALANYINVATGRGSAGQRANVMVGLNTAFFAPRYVLSRFQLLLGQPMYRGSKRTRMLVAQEYARFLIGLGSVYALADLMGADIENDPRSSDFGKMRVGTTRIDPLAGIAQSTVLLSRLGTGETKRLSGKVVPIRGDDVPYGSSDAADVIGRFLRSKLSPVFGAGVDVASGKNVVGERVSQTSVATNLTTPLALRDIYDVMHSMGVPKGTAISLLAIFGMSVQDYDTNAAPRERKKRRTFRDLVEWR